MVQTPSRFTWGLDGTGDVSEITEFQVEVVEVQQNVCQTMPNLYGFPMKKYEEPMFKCLPNLMKKYFVRVALPQKPSSA